MSENKLKEMAIEAATKAYAPYSKFKVGCALLTTSGNIYTGCNVENASFGLTTCAERNAIANAVNSEGAIGILSIVVYTSTPTPTPPCGACRQVIYEFAKNTTTISYCDSEEVFHHSINDLLPGAFEFKNKK
ncbi:cytidine deaminase [Ekhidna sp.]|uniref:cytidine deaminase n=1 Tax=Ekhidna sp. TaxID=2608089 RepID=UPI0032EC5190